MAADLFIAQHRGPDGPGRRHRLGYFATLAEAKQALEERWEPGSWQGIRREGTGDRWWRDNHTQVWVGPRRSRSVWVRRSPHALRTLGAGAAMATVRVVKRKWDGTVSAVDSAFPLAVPGDNSAWLVVAGSLRERPASGAIEVVGSDELWVAVPAEWWVLCGYTDATRSLNGYKVHAAAPFEAPGSADEILWVDLDLDFEVTGDQVALQDEAQFHDHARTMGYPDEVVRGAWMGISTIAARYTNGEWPFDGSMQHWLDDAQQ